MPFPPRFDDWMRALEERHLANLRVQEVTRALRALSSVYVERRHALQHGAALDSAGKRVAFALFYGPLHYLLTRHIVQAVGGHGPGIDLVVDLGCGTGAAGAAWAGAIAEGGRREGEDRDAAAPRVLGLDRHPWAIDEARWTYRAMGLSGTARREDVARAQLKGRRSAFVLAFTVNELPEEARAAVLPRLEAAASRGARILVVEPLARSIGDWWVSWSETFRRLGGREDTWRIEADLPERLRLFDRAAGLDHRVLSARSLYLAPSA